MLSVILILVNKDYHSCFPRIFNACWRGKSRFEDRQTGQTGQDNGPTALGEPFYKRSPKNTLSVLCVSFVTSLSSVLRFRIPSMHSVAIVSLCVVFSLFCRLA